MHSTARRTLAAGAAVVVGLVGPALPAQANEDLGCDPDAVAAALTEAEAESRAAQKAFTSHTRTKMQALVKDLKVTEKAEARAAAKEARKLKAQAKKDPALRQEAKEAKRAARAEAKEARQVQRAGHKELKRLVKAERKVLKAEWDAAKAAWQELEAYAAACEESGADEPGEGTVDEPGMTG